MLWMQFWERFSRFRALQPREYRFYTILIYDGLTTPPPPPFTPRNRLVRVSARPHALTSSPLKKRGENRSTAKRVQKMQTYYVLRSRILHIINNWSIYKIGRLAFSSMCVCVCVFSIAHRLCALSGNVLKLLSFQFGCLIFYSVLNLSLSLSAYTRHVWHILAAESCILRVVYAKC